MKDGILSKSPMHRWQYYAVQWTWGILPNILGLIIFIVAKCKRWPIDKYRNAIRIHYPKSFGGLSLGMFFIIGKNNISSSAHEYGHGLQNLNWGILYPFVISLPSAARWWYRKLKYWNKGLDAPTPYDSIWFEKQATQYGKLAEKEKWDWL